jgi:hypothetical protein
MIGVDSVEAVADYGLLLTFNSGERRRFDMRPYLHFPVFRRLVSLTGIKEPPMIGVMEPV